MESTVKDFKTLTEAKEKITEIASIAVDRSDKLLKIKASDVLPQMAEYLQKVLQPHFKENFSKSGWLSEINIAGGSEYGGGIHFRQCCQSEQNKGNHFYICAYSGWDNTYIVFTDEGFHINRSLGDALNRIDSDYSSRSVGAMISIWEKLKNNIGWHIERHYQTLIDRAKAEVDKQLLRENVFAGFVL